MAAVHAQQEHMLGRRSLWDLFERTPATTSGNVDEGIIVEGQDQVYGDIAELRKSCVIYMKEMIRLQEEDANTMDEFSRSGRKVLKQVEKDVAFNGCQILLNVFNAYHETLVSEDKPLPYYLVEERERKEHKKSHGKGTNLW